MPNSRALGSIVVALGAAGMMSPPVMSSAMAADDQVHQWFVQERARTDGQPGPLPYPAGRDIAGAHGSPGITKMAAGAKRAPQKICSFFNHPGLDTVLWRVPCEPPLVAIQPHGRCPFFDQPGLDVVLWLEPCESVRKRSVAR